MTEAKNQTKIKAIKVSRNGDPTGPFNISWEKSFDEIYDHQIGGFLYNLFWTIEDFGALIPTYLNMGLTYFSGNAYCGDLIENNTIRFKDYEQNFIHEMNFDEFMRVNKEYHELYENKANDIWFKIIGNKVILEGAWLNNNNLD